MAATATVLCSVLRIELNPKQWQDVFLEQPTFRAGACRKLSRQHSRSSDLDSQIVNTELPVIHLDIVVTELSPYFQLR